MNNEQFLYYNFWYHCTDIYVVFYPCIFYTKFMLCSTPVFLSTKFMLFTYSTVY